ncbi:flavanone 3-dioxygenase 2-like [Henckelia pumila]|uniref:flavanone 3-dioxygenase 2-like n=1 Tax=Henckelia pumila TaxID=405737 RepID=UPI003C6E8D25
MSLFRRSTPPASMQNMCMPRTKAAFQSHTFSPTLSVGAGRMAASKCSSAQINSTTSDYTKGVKSLLESTPHLQKLPSEFLLQFDQNPMDAAGGSDIPTIDLSGLDGSAESKASTIKAIGDACVEWGFFRVKNHGIDEKVISETLEVIEEFFGQSLEEKMKYYSEDVLSPIRYGTSLNTPLAHKLHWRDYLRHYGHPFPDTIFQLWPDNPPKYRNIVKAYLVEIWKLTMKIGGAISQNLGLEEGYFERSLGEGVQIIACNYYPPCPEPNKTLGLAAHSDHGGLTILMENGVEGLQIKHDGTWVSVHDVPSTLVVNVGDYLEILSNGRYKSIEHRATVNQHKTRISVAVGHGPEMSTIVRPAAPLVNETDHQYRSVTYKDYVKLQQSITSRGKNALEKLRIDV